MGAVRELGVDFTACSTSPAVAWRKISQSLLKMNSVATSFLVDPGVYFDKHARSGEEA